MTTLRQMGAKIGSRVRFIEDPEGQWRTVKTDAELDYAHLLPWVVEDRTMNEPIGTDERLDRIEALEAKLRQSALQELSALGQASEAYQAQLAAEAKLAKAVEEKLDAISTLDAWFDRRKLAHNAVDQAVVDAASGYLRTSRVGGMPQEESDLILGVIQDMAHLSVFADLFARTTLAELKGQDDE